MITPFQEKIKKRRQLTWIMGASIYLVISALIITLVFRPKNRIRVMADLHVDQVHFIHKSGHYNLNGRALSGINLAYFQDIRIEADSFALDEELSGVYSESQKTNSSITLTPYPESAGISLPITGKVVLEQLPISEKALVTLSRPHQDIEQGVVRFMVAQEQILDGNISYHGEVNLVPEQTEVKGVPNKTDFFSPTGLKLIAPADKTLNMYFRSFPGNFFMELSMQEGLDIKGSSLEIDSLFFYRQDENLSNEVPISTILGGEIQFIEAGNDPLNILTLRERQELNLGTKQPLHLEQLQVSDKGIRLLFSGIVGKIQIGARGEVFNPSWFEWLWHNHRYPMAGIGILLLGFIFFLPAWLKNKILAVVKTGKDFF